MVSWTSRGDMAVHESSKVHDSSVPTMAFPEDPMVKEETPPPENRDANICHYLS